MFSIIHQLRYLPQTLTAALICTLVVACGEKRQQKEQASLEWLQSRPYSQRYAYLTNEDLEDVFLLGISVIEVDDFLSSALNMSVPSQKVRLSLEDGDEGQKKLRVKTLSDQEVLSFNVVSTENQWEIDFASSGNDVRLRQLVDVIGGIFTSGNRNGYWISEGSPTVGQVFQDNDTAVVDLVHTVSQVITEKDVFGRTVIKERLSQHPGKVTLRLWLKRQKSLPSLSGNRTVGMGKQFNIGFFGSVIMPGTSEGDQKLIQRFPLESEGTPGSVTIYLKDFPVNFIDISKKAVASWNQAFGYDAIQAEVAPSYIDAGDPRYHVIKWYDGTDRNLPWAGVAKMMVDPDSGVVLSGNVYIQGSTLLDAYRKIVSFTEDSSRGGMTSMEGSIGRLDFTATEGEVPVIPYYTNVGSSFEAYMKGYYFETIVHEVGHILGLRHNFKGSTQFNGEGSVASIMDYLPRAHRHDFRGPGKYDIAAIRWGYFGEEPTEDLAFCTDEQLWKVWDCHQSDLGDPVNYVIRALIDGATLLAQKPILVSEKKQISSVAVIIEQAHKLWKLKDQMSAANKQRVEQELAAAYKFFFEVEPASWLSEEEEAIAAKNLKLMRDLANLKIMQLKAQGNI